MRFNPSRFLTYFFLTLATVTIVVRGVLHWHRQANAQGIVAGSVNVANTPAVTVSGGITLSGQPINTSASVMNTPAVTVGGTPTVSVANTPAVTVSGTPTVSATVTGTPTVSVVGTPTVSAAVTGTPTVSVSNTPAVTVSGTPTVSVSNTPAVTVSGTPTINVTQFGGTAISTGTGAGGLGIPRITVSNDSSLAANQSVNVAQMNAVAVTMGNGIAGTGVQRVALASDNSAVSGVGAGATGSAVPANAVYLGGNGTANLTGITVCDTQQRISITANTQMITGTAAKHIYICHIDLVVAAATNVAVVSGTGAVCATGIAGVFGGSTAATGWNFAANGGIAQGTGIGWVGRTVATGDNICILVSAANQTSGNIVYTVY